MICTCGVDDEFAGLGIGHHPRCITLAPEPETMRETYYKARRARIAAREHYDATVCEEQRLAQKLRRMLNVPDGA